MLDPLDSNGFKVIVPDVKEKINNLIKKYYGTEQ